MEAYILPFILIFIIGAVVGGVGVVMFIKYKTGSITSTEIKKEYDAYQGDVEKHFEETSTRLKEMTQQYQELYKHLAVGATTLCRPDSVAAGIADQSEPELKLEQQADKEASEAAQEPKLAEEVSTVPDEAPATETNAETGAESSDASHQSSDSVPEADTDNTPEPTDSQTSKK